MPKTIKIYLLLLICSISVMVSCINDKNTENINPVDTSIYYYEVYDTPNQYYNYTDDYIVQVNGDTI